MSIVPAAIVHQRQAQASLGGDQHGRQDLRHHVAGRDQVDVMAARLLQPDHDPGQLFGLDLLAGVGLADVVILAILTAQVTVGEENRPGTAPAAQGVLLAQVRPVAAHPGQFAGAADAQFPAAPVHTAFPAAAGAVGQVFIGLGDALAQLAALKQGQVGRLEGHLLRISLA